jgi:predicted nucleic acid-binding protein
VDTSAWLALINERDDHHAPAVQFVRGLEPTSPRVTTWGVVSETYTWLRYHVGYRAADRWLHEEAALEAQDVLEVVYPDSATDMGLRQELSRFEDQKLSYVDALTLHLVRSRNDIDAVFAFDHHLTLAGVPMLPGIL